MTSPDAKPRGEVVRVVSYTDRPQILVEDLNGERRYITVGGGDGFYEMVGKCAVVVHKGHNVVDVVDTGMSKENAEAVYDAIGRLLDDVKSLKQDSRRFDAIKAFERERRD